MLAAGTCADTRTPDVFFVECIERRVIGVIAAVLIAHMRVGRRSHAMARTSAERTPHTGRRRASDRNCDMYSANVVTAAAA